jgi:hypothetical protein
MAFAKSGMKQEAARSFVTADQAEQMGADMAIQFMLMTLFQIVSGMADDPRGFRLDVHRELIDLIGSHKLPATPGDSERKIRTAARRVLDGIMMRSFEQNA